MDIYKLFPPIPLDKANHEVYGARIGCIGAVIAALVVYMVLPYVGLHIERHVCIVAGLTSVALALLAGVIKERFDRISNEQAESAGEPATHSVEGDDVFATIRGGASVAAPLLLSWILQQ